jgi:single-stranded-DNA-specific exonuclease
MPEMIEPFRKKFIEVSGRCLSDEDIIPKLNIDREIELTDIDDAFMDALETFAPFGPQNMRPVFLTRNCDIVGLPYIVGNNHLRMRVQKGSSTLDVIGFGLGDLVSQISTRGCLVDIVYALEYNTYNDVTRKQIRLKDLKLTAGTASPTDR